LRNRALGTRINGEQNWELLIRGLNWPFTVKSFIELAIVRMIGGCIIEFAGINSKVTQMNRPSPATYSLPHKFLLCLAILMLPALLAAQSSPQPATETTSATSQAQTTDQSAAGNIAPTDAQAAGAIPTAASIEADGVRATDPADPKPAVSEVANLAATITPPPAPEALSHEPAKYDVTLIGHRNIGAGLNFYSLEREIAVGQDLAKQVEQSSKLVTDPAVTEYINRIGQNLVRNSDSRVPFTIKVIDSGEVNAFALPGGFFYVDSGLILAAETEAELAAVMAHEIAHVAARHATKNMTKQQIWQMASIPLMFIGGPAGYALAEVASFAVPLSFLKFNRDAEREADMLGLQYDYAAGYDPQAFIQFFERLKAEEKQKHSKIAKMFSTHPMTADRITSAQAEIRTYFPDRDSYVIDTSEFDAMKTHLLALQGGLRLKGDKGGNRPVLRKHADAEEGSVTTQTAPTTTPSQKAPASDDPPVLKRTSTSPN
jgi:hypothetical protein